MVAAARSVRCHRRSIDGLPVAAAARKLWIDRRPDDCARTFRSIGVMLAAAAACMFGSIGNGSMLSAASNY